MHQRKAETGLRRIQGVLNLAKKYGSAACDNACAAGLELGVAEYRFVRRYLERTPQASLSLKQSRSSHPRADAVSRLDPTTIQLRGEQTMNLIELNQSLRQLRLSGMSAVLETRLLQAQAENIAPIDLVSMLVSDELACHQPATGAAP
jgi:hypothetical protein